MTLLRTPRLLLETLSDDEAAAVRSGDRDGRAWADDYPTEGDVLVAGVVLEAGEHRDPSGPLGVFQVRLREGGDAVGGIGFLSAPTADGEAEVGYGLAESVRGRGLATEALRAVCAHAAEHGVRVVLALTDPDNVASQRVLEHVGFVRDEVPEQTESGPMLRWTLPVGG